MFGWGNMWLCRFRTGPGELEYKVGIRSESILRDPQRKEGLGFQEAKIVFNMMKWHGLPKIKQKQKRYRQGSTFRAISW